MINHEREMAHLVELANTLARDDKPTTAMLALLRTGHPGSNLHGPRTEPGDDPGEPTYGDPTGEAAISDDHAVTEGRAYIAAIDRAIAALAHADAIRRRCIARHTATVGISRDSSEWCRNHLDAGRLAPRGRDGGIHCGWCRNQLAAYGVLPDLTVVEMHDRGIRTDKAMQALKRTVHQR